MSTSTIDSSTGPQRQYVDCDDGAQRKKDHVRFKEPSPATDQEDAPLLVRDDLEAGERSRWSEEIFEDKADCARDSIKGLIRRHFLITLLTCIFVVGTAFVCIKDVVNRYRGTSMALCTTPGCVVAAAELIRDMSPDQASINPCDDFRKFTCEGFDKTHGLRAEQSTTQTLTIMGETAQNVLRQVLESPASAMHTGSSSQQDNFGKIQTAYNTCMNETAIQHVGNDPLLELLSGLQDIDKSREVTITAGVEYLMRLGETALIGLGVSEDDRNPDQQIVFLSGPSLGLGSKPYYKDEQKVTLYSQTINAVLTRLEQNENTEICAQSEICGQLTSFAKPSAIQNLVEFESKIAAATPDTEKSQDPKFYYNPLNITDIEKLLPQVSVSTLINKKAPGYLLRAIIVESPAYLQSLSGILETTSDETIQLYLYWKLILGFQSEIESHAMEPLREFNNRLQGKDATAKPERWRTCIGHVSSGLGWLLSYYYVNETFTEKSKEFGDHVIQDIRDQFVVKINGSAWMSEDVREVAIDKVHSIRQKIGYPTKSPNIKDPQQLQDYYSGVNVTGGYFANSLSMTKDSLKRTWAKAGKPTDRDAWLMTASTVNVIWCFVEGRMCADKNF